MSQQQEIELKDRNQQPTATSPTAEEEDEEEEEETVVKAKLSERISKGFRRFVKGTKYLMYHKTKGRSYFCDNTCDFWCKNLFFMIALYMFVAGFFMAYMAIGSELFPFTFFYTKIPLTNPPMPVPARDYFGTRNTTNATVIPFTPGHPPSLTINWLLGN
ncbi:hypothetical protein ABK040_011344 [Willaertia magna]